VESDLGFTSPNPLLRKEGASWRHTDLFDCTLGLALEREALSAAERGIADNKMTAFIAKGRIER